MPSIGSKRPNMPQATPTIQPNIHSDRSDLNRSSGLQPVPPVGRTSTENNTFRVHGSESNQTDVQASERTGIAREASASTSSSAPALENLVNGGSLLRRGAKGPEVRDLQRLLNRSGANLGVDGDFGPSTQRALRSYQRENGLGADGVVGPNSLGSLIEQSPAGNNRPTSPRTVARRGQPLAKPNPEAASATTNPTPIDAASESAPISNNFVTEPGRVSSGFGATAGQREAQAEEIMRANGAWPPENGRAYAVQIDQDSPSTAATRGERRDFLRNYTGETAVFRAENGRLVEQRSPLSSASHPGQTRSSLSTDGNGDGVGDVANIRPGVYRYRTRQNGAGRFNPVTNSEFANSARDLNHNGLIDGVERGRNYQATGIQIHAGRPDGPSSIGCQTMPPNDYREFTDAVRGANTGNNSEFTYILVRRPNETHGANSF